MSFLRGQALDAQIKKR